jgi:hypothetical protein
VTIPHKKGLVSNPGDDVPQQLARDIAPGTKVAWYTAAGEIGRAIYDFGDSDPITATVEKWKAALAANDPLGVHSIDSTQTANCVCFVNPHQITGFKVFEEMNAARAVG